MSQALHSARRPVWFLMAILLVVSITLAGIGLSPGSDAHAAQTLDELKAEMDQREAELRAIERDMNAKRAGLKKAHANKSQLERDIARLQAQINRFEGEIHDLQNQLDGVENELSITEANLQQAIKDLEKRIDLAGKRIRALQENGTVSVLEILVASRSFTDFLTRFSYLQQMLRQDVQLLYDVKNEKARIEGDKAQLEENRAALVTLRDEARAQLAHIASIRDARETALIQTEDEIDKLREQLDELDRISEQINADLQKLEKLYEEELKKRGISFTGLRWPLPRGGWISSPYGNRYHPILKTWKMHTGLDVAIAKGTNIYAAAGGKVVRAGWLGGYGKTVMILHGQGTDGKSYSTLYAHASVLRVKEGQIVKQGQHIADVGSTGYSTGPHLHFEVRVNGQHTNPLNYVSKP